MKLGMVMGVRVVLVQSVVRGLDLDTVWDVLSSCSHTRSRPNSHPVHTTQHHGPTMHPCSANIRLMATGVHTDDAHENAQQLAPDAKIAHGPLAPQEQHRVEERRWDGGKLPCRKGTMVAA